MRAVVDSTRHIQASRRHNSVVSSLSETFEICDVLLCHCKLVVVVAHVSDLISNAKLTRNLVYNLEVLVNPLLLGSALDLKSASSIANVGLVNRH